jgi:hypothetical protein
MIQISIPYSLLELSIEMAIEEAHSLIAASDEPSIHTTEILARLLQLRESGLEAGSARILVTDDDFNNISFLADEWKSDRDITRIRTEDLSP